MQLLKERPKTFFVLTMQTFIPPIFYSAPRNPVSQELRHHIKVMFEKYSQDNQTITRHNFKLACIACFGFHPVKV